MFKTIAAAALMVAAVSVGAQTPKKETQAQLKKEAKISLTSARATALKEVPNGRVSKSELEREDGKLIYSFDVKVPGKSGWEEVNVDAVSGTVVSKEHETPKMEAKEKKAEQKKH
jgi:uncharacterized membrane protein YkoI